MAERTLALRRRLSATFASLRNPNFRRYFAAQIASKIGNWIQITAENWLVLQLTAAGEGGLGFWDHQRVAVRTFSVFWTLRRGHQRSPRPPPLSGVYFSLAGIFLLGVSCGIFNGRLWHTASDSGR